MKNHNINVCHLNIFHLFNKLPDINVLLSKQKKSIQILGLTETRLDHRIDDYDISINNYTLFRRDKKQERHTGIAAYVHNAISNQVRRRMDLEYKEIESLWLEVKHEKNTPLLICFLYRNPTCTAEWQIQFQNMIDNIPDKNHELLILGDFNIDLKKTQQSWNSLTSLLGLSQLISDYTRVTKTTKTMIDHIYSRNIHRINNVKVIESGVSDHYLISCSYLKKVEKNSPKGHSLITYRCYKHFQEDKFLAHLRSLPLEKIHNFTDPNTALESMCDMLKSAFNKHAPLKSKRVKHPDIPAWLNPDIIKAMRLRDQFKKEKNTTEFKKHRNLVNVMVKNAKKDYFNNLVQNNKDTATIWKAINKLTNPSRKTSKSLKIDINPDTINDFFINLHHNILTKEIIESNKKYECPPKLVDFCKKKNAPINFEIPLMTTLEVGKYITNLKNTKSSGPDMLPSYLLKIALPYIVGPLTYIYNLSITKHTFPTLLKEAKVIPIPKTQDTTTPQNLRPISLLPILSKPLERHIHKYMYKHLNDNNLLHPYQSGFRPQHSCQTAHTNLIDKWLKEINNSEIIGTLFLDFKKAFDLVNHATLLKKLNEYYPNSSAMNLIHSYLTNRTQFVSLNGKQSHKKLIQSGVPQGSVLGPLFFLIYINDLPLQLTKDVHNELFADDATLFTLDKNIKSINNSLQHSLNQTLNWCNKNSMIIHPDKTKCMIVTTRQKHQISPLILDLKLGRDKIEQVKQHKVLGLWIDSELNWQYHITTLIKRLSRNVFLLSQLKKYTTSTNLKMFFDAHIMSHLNFSSTTWDGSSGEFIKKLNSIHRRAVKIMINNPLTTDEKFKKLSILPLSTQFKFNKAKLMHKIYTGKSPPYLNKLVKKASERYGSNNIITPLPRIDLYKTSFSFTGATIWNSLTADLKKLTSPKAFAGRLFKQLINS